MESCNLSSSVDAAMGNHAIAPLGICANVPSDAEETIVHVSFIGEVNVELE